MSLSASVIFARFSFSRTPLKLSKLELYFFALLNLQSSAVSTLFSLCGSMVAPTNFNTAFCSKLSAAIERRSAGLKG